MPKRCRSVTVGVSVLPRWGCCGGKTETLTRSSQGMQVIGMRATQADNALCASPGSRGEMMIELEPLVARDKRINEVQTQDRHIDASTFKPGQMQGLQRSMGLPVRGGEHHEMDRQGKVRSLTLPLRRQARSHIPKGSFPRSA